MRPPIQLQPVRRHIILRPTDPESQYAYRSVDQEHEGVPGDPGRVIRSSLEELFIHLKLGANYNDPPVFQHRSYQQLRTSERCGYW